jgi:hypothetical protein
MSQEPPLVHLRDLAEVEPPRDRYAQYENEDIYRLVPRPQWTGLEDEVWTPRSNQHDPQLEKVKALMKRNAEGSSTDSISPRANLSGTLRCTSPPATSRSGHADPAPQAPPLDGTLSRLLPDWALITPPSTSV